MQGCLYGGQNTEGHLGDAWLFDAETMTWQQTATSDFGGFSDAAKAWHAAAVLKCTDVSPQCSLFSSRLLSHSCKHASVCKPPLQSFCGLWVTEVDGAHMSDLPCMIGSWQLRLMTHPAEL